MLYWHFPHSGVPAAGHASHSLGKYESLFSWGYVRTVAPPHTRLAREAALLVIGNLHDNLASAHAARSRGTGKTLRTSAITLVTRVGPIAREARPCAYTNTNPTRHSSFNLKENTCSFDSLEIQSIKVRQCFLTSL